MSYHCLQIIHTIHIIQIIQIIQTTQIIQIVQIIQFSHTMLIIQIIQTRNISYQKDLDHEMRIDDTPCLEVRKIFTKQKKRALVCLLTPAQNNRAFIWDHVAFVTTELVSLLVGLKNQRGHWLCPMSTGRKNGLM